MITVKQLIEKLKNYHDDAICYAYEGEVIGVVIRDKDNKEELGYIATDVL